MSRRANQAALQIRLLLEEFSPEELSEAVLLLGGDPVQEDIATFLTRIGDANRGSRRKVRTSSHTPAGKLPELEALKESDVEKYRLLKAFERDLIEGAVLPSMEEVRLFGLSLDKTFESGKSRRAAIRHVITLLTTLSTEAVQAAVNRIARSSAGRGGFQRLADHLITGGHPAGR